MNPSPRHRSESDEAIEATAAAWLAEQDGGLTPEAAVEFTRWRQADLRHEAAVARLEATQEALRQMLGCGSESHDNSRELLARPARFPGRFPALAAAAALAVGLMLFAAWRWWPRPNLTLNQTATTAGEYQRVPLPDGSVIELNAGSEVRVNFTPGERRLWLVRGEAHFLVSKNKQRPFWVEAGTVTVRAVGTAFDMRLQAGGVEVLVTEGSVQVRRAEAPAFGGLEMAMLVAGQRSVIPFQNIAARPAVETVAPALITKELAWERPRLVFVDTPLAQVVDQFNRRNQVQLELADPELGLQPSAGSFSPDNVEAFVRLLTSGNDIVVERPEANHIILRRARH